MSSQSIAKGMIRKARYNVTLSSTTLRVTMTGYGLKASETHELQFTQTKHGLDNRDAAILADKMTVLENRMASLARLVTQLEANGLSGVTRTSGPSVSKKAKGVNPLTALMNKV